MSAINKKFPTTYAELTALAGNQLKHFAASYDEYWEFLKVSEFRADFYRNKIIAMSYENEIHARIANKLSAILTLIAFPGSTRKFSVYNPNRPVYVNDCKGHAVFNPDGSVAEKPVQLHEHSKGMNATVNPILLFEVLSPSTENYDWATKLPCYKQIDSLQTIIYLEASESKVYLMERLGENQWKETTFTKATDSFEINGTTITLEEIYLDIHF